MYLERTIPARKKIVNFCWVKKDFTEMSPAFRKIRSGMRNKMDKCFWCGHEFAEGEMMALGGTNKGNKMLCCSCVAEIAVPVAKGETK